MQSLPTDIIRQSPLTPTAYAARCGVSVRTWLRHEQSERAPATVCAMLPAVLGDLGTIHPDWRGWFLNPANGHLSNTDGYWSRKYWTMTDMRCLGYDAAQQSYKRHQIKRLEGVILNLKMEIDLIGQSRGHSGAANAPFFS